MEQKGTCVISIDYEFAWGYADKGLSDRHKTQVRQEAAIVERLIRLFERYDIPVTWAIVGHLLEEECSWHDGLPHPEYLRPIQDGEKHDHFSQHPKEGETDDVAWFDAQRLVDTIARSRVKHEIGSHSYAHILYDERSTKRQAVEADMANVQRIHRQRGLPLTSFVFPRNVEGYHGLLHDAGVRVFRGAGAKWYDAAPGPLRRACHLLDHFLPYGRTVSAHRHPSGLVNVPDSMLIIGRNGIRRCIPAACTIRKAERSIARATRRGEVFHLWFHPSNFSYATDTQFRILEEILRNMKEEKDKGAIEVVTLGHFSEEASHSGGSKEGGNVLQR